MEHAMEKVYLIGNAHIDPVWLWRWQEGYAEVKATFRSALDRLKEYDDLKFTSACSAYYMWIEESDKEMFAEIQQRVKEGRWELAGGQMIQPDCNIPSGESFARHALISQRYFQEKFGVMAKTGYNVDSFGHNGSLPKLLQNSGIDSYVFMRPEPHEKELPAWLFDWESADGSRVRTYRIPGPYCIQLQFLNRFKEIDQIAQDTKTPMMAFFGVGNHGGGPTVELLETMKKELPDNFVYATLKEYFDLMQAREVPVVADDLQFHAKGCYSANSEVKTNNRKAETMLFQTEAFSVLSNKLVQTPYPEDALNVAWCDVLFNQFHDIMGGCSIREAYPDARMIHNEAMAIASRKTNFALQQLSWKIDTTAGKELALPNKTSQLCQVWTAEEIGTPLALFNPLATPRRAVAEVFCEPEYVTDDQGNLVYSQRVRDGKVTGCRNKTLIDVELPALGYGVYRLHFDKTDAKLPESSVKAGENFLENALIKAVFDPATGELCQLYDKKQGRDLLSGQTGAVLMDETESDTWGHGIVFYKKLAAACQSGSIKVTESGPLRASMRCQQSFENTQITRDYTLAEHSDQLQVRVKVDFREKHRMLKFTIPVKAENPKAVCEIPFGSMEKTVDGAEYATQSWFALGDGQTGLGVATDSKYSFDAEGNQLSLTVLRGTLFADHSGPGENRDEFCVFMDQGEHEFQYILFPFAAKADAAVRAQELLNQPIGVVETFHKGPLGTSFSGISVSPANIVVTALKKHRDSDAYVLRCYEAEGRDTQAEICLFGTKFQADFGHDQVKTFIVDGANVRETNFLEY